MLADAIRAAVGDGVAVIDSALATASALAEMLAVNELGAPCWSAAGARAADDRDMSRFRDTLAPLRSEFAAMEPVVVAEAA